MLLRDVDGFATELDADALDAFAFDLGAGVALDHDRGGRRGIVVFPTVVAELWNHLAVHEHVHLFRIRGRALQQQFARGHQIGGERYQGVAEFFCIGYLVVLRGLARGWRAAFDGERIEHDLVVRLVAAGNADYERGDTSLGQRLDPSDGLVTVEAEQI